MDAVSKHGNIKLTDYKLNTAAIEILDEKISKYEYAT